MSLACKWHMCEQARDTHIYIRIYVLDMNTGGTMYGTITGISTVKATAAPILPQCKTINVGNYSYLQSPVKYNGVTNQFKEANCLYFECETDVSKCDNYLLTNYDGPERPCCVHILRDMSRIWDEEMCRIGVDYYASFGTLLGLIRSDRLIPWTGDGDYVIPSENHANAIVSLWNTKRTGLAHIYQRMNRICVTPDFQGGKLTKWGVPAPRTPPTPLTPPPPTPRPQGKSTINIFVIAPSIKNANALKQKAVDIDIVNTKFPYIDLYIGKTMPENSSVFSEGQQCRHLYDRIFPTARQYFYKNTVPQRIPLNPEGLLRIHYGGNWTEPSPNREVHGDDRWCPYRDMYSL